MKPEFADHFTIQEMLARAAALASQTTTTSQVRASPCHHFTQMSESKDVNPIDQKQFSVLVETHVFDTNFTCLTCPLHLGLKWCASPETSSLLTKLHTRCSNAVVEEKIACDDKTDFMLIFAE